MTFSVERADKFLELAQGRANENESRNAAMMLVKLLSKAGFNFSKGFNNYSNQEFIDLQKQNDRQYRTIKELKEDNTRLRNELSVADVRIEVLQEKVNSLEYIAKVKESRRESAYERQEPKKQFRRMKAKYASKCRVCGDPIFVDEWVYWLPDEGVRHERCHS